MKFSEIERKFVCIKGFQEVNRDCLVIPKNKVWSEKIFKFVCVKDFHEMKDESCDKPKLNERYDEK